MHCAERRLAISAFLFVVGNRRNDNAIGVLFPFVLRQLPRFFAPLVKEGSVVFRQPASVDTHPFAVTNAIERRASVEQQTRLISNIASVFIERFRPFIEGVPKQPVVAIGDVNLARRLAFRQFVVLAEQTTILFLFVGNSNLLRNRPPSAHVELRRVPVIDGSVLNELEPANNPSVSFAIIVEHSGRVIGELPADEVPNRNEVGF